MKNDVLSVEKRKIGNDFYVKEDYDQALNYYQQSLVLASSKENKASSYGNISAVYAALKDGKSSILNIAAARKLHTPKNGQDAFLERLSRREQECNRMDSPPFVNTFRKSSTMFESGRLNIGELLGSKNNLYTKSFPIGLPLSYPPNPKVPGLVDRVGKAEKTLYAMKDMHFGDVIAVTKSVGMKIFWKWIGNRIPPDQKCWVCTFVQIVEFQRLVSS